MYNLIEYSLNSSETTASLWFYSKDETTNFDADIANGNNLNSFECKAELLGNKVAQPNPNNANGIIRNAATTAPLKYLNNFRDHPELIPNLNQNLNRQSIMFYLQLVMIIQILILILFLLSKILNFAPVVTLSAEDDQKLSKLLSNGFERSAYWNKYKTKSENKNTTN